MRGLGNTPSLILSRWSCPEAVAPGSLEQKDFQETTPKDNSQDLIIHGSLAVRRRKKVYLLIEF